MKMKRMIASVLALLLMVSLLPIGVMAAEDNNAGQTVDVIASGDTMNSNMGTVTTNNGEVRSNHGTVETNNGTIEFNYSGGTVSTNSENGTVETNREGTIKTNNGTVNINDMSGIIETNKGEVLETGLGSIVETNAKGGTVDTNNGTVMTNNGTVTTNNGNVSWNNGTVTTNNGSMDYNDATGTIETNNYQVMCNEGTVETNAKGGKIEDNSGTVETNNGSMDYNHATGIIETNKGEVLENGIGSTVETNAKGGEIETNNGTVGEKDENGNAVADTGNNGTIKTNNGTVITNNETGTVVTNAKGGEIETNNGTVGVVDRYESTPNGYGKPIPEDGTGNFGNIDINNGSLIVNHEDATVGINNGDIELNYGDIDTNNDYVAWNYGTVETNTIDGTVWNETTQDQNGQNVTGTVTNNYGTMITNTGKVDEDGRSIYKTEYGVQVQNTDGGAGTKLLQAVENTIVKLADLFKRDGYELVGYNDITPEPEYPDEDWDGPVEYALNNNPSAQELSATEFQATRPSILSLIWKAIVKPAAPSGSSGEPEPKTVQNNIPTTLSADQVKVGAYVRQGNLLFRIIEVGDDYIRVATVPKLSEQALADMLGFLKQHLSDAQIAKINGEPALLEQELVTYFFGGTFEHISFYAAPDLFA